MLGYMFAYGKCRSEFTSYKYFLVKNYCYKNIGSVVTKQKLLGLLEEENILCALAENHMFIFPLRAFLACFQCTHLHIVTMMV
jgi:hypothetical protein